MTAKNNSSSMASVGVTSDLLAGLRDGRAVYVRLDRSAELLERVVACSGVESIVVEAWVASQGVDVSGRYPTLVRMCREVR